MPRSVIVQLPGVDRFFGLGPPDGLLRELFSFRFLLVDGYPVDGAVSFVFGGRTAGVFLLIPPYLVGVFLYLRFG